MKTALEFPTPANLGWLWNFGSLMGWCLVMQITTGLLLVVHYTPSVEDAFNSVIHIMRDVHYGWLIRSFHANGASMFFICVYIHVARGLFYESFFLKHTWLSGVTMLILLMAIAFTGYVLPWGQMSYWGATVITNLFSAIPKIGSSIVALLWGGDSVCDATLKRFFALHFLMPFILLVLMLFHLAFLHTTGSSNPLGLDISHETVPFYPYYFYKDLLGIGWYMVMLCSICFLVPDLFADPENFIRADPMKTPVHIQPEWYFLFAYSILRSIPNKMGGVLALASSLLILYILPFISSSSHIRGFQYNPLAKIYFWLFVTNFIILSYTGACPVEYPFMQAGLFSTVFYFMYFLTSWMPKKLWEMMMNTATKSK
nr:cytochrome b [Mytilopsis leucophaeata]